VILLDKKYKTRDGQRVVLYTTTAFGRYNVEGWVGGEKHNWNSEGYLVDTVEDYDHDLDLIEIDPLVKRTVWLIILDDDSIEVCTSEEVLKEYEAHPRVRNTIKTNIEYVKGRVIQ